MKSLFFSVIIPLYNKENYITKTLESVYKQTYKNFEVIVINDGSKDKSLDKVNAYFSSIKKSNFKIISRENKGLSATRNQSIKYSNGDFIAFLDADDTWHKDYLLEQSKLINTISDSDIKVFGTSYYQVYNKTTLICPKINLPIKAKEKQVIIDDFFDANLFQNLIVPSSFVIDREVFKDNLFNTKIDYSEDIDFFIRVFSIYKLAYLRKHLVFKNECVDGQITQYGPGDKIIPDFGWYESNITMTKSLKKFINRCRFMFASHYKQVNNEEKFRYMLSKLNFNELSWKQKLLLKLPNWISNSIIHLKKSLLKRGIRITTFSN